MSDLFNAVTGDFVFFLFPGNVFMLLPTAFRTEGRARPDAAVISGSGAGCAELVDVDEYMQVSIR